MSYDLRSIGGDFYVYGLAYPESMGEAIFYVGKGAGQRVGDHEREARKGIQSRKCDIIRDIWSHGEQVVRKIFAIFRREQDAHMYEWAMINMTTFAETLANKKGGTGRHYEPYQVATNTFSWALPHGRKICVTVCPDHFEIELTRWGAWKASTLASLRFHGVTQGQIDFLISAQNAHRKAKQLNDAAKAVDAMIKCDGAIIL